MSLIVEANSRANVLAIQYSPDLCNITRISESKDTGGAIIYGSRTTIYEDVPVTYLPTNKSVKDEKSGKFISVVNHELLLPRYFAETIDLRADDRITVQARGNEPATVFRILAIENFSGVYLKANCTLENTVATTPGNALFWGDEILMWGDEVLIWE